MENIVLFIPITAYILDAIFGEPSTKFHPVCWLGNTALYLEQKNFLQSKIAPGNFYTELPAQVF